MGESSGRAGRAGTLGKTFPSFFPPVSGQINSASLILDY